MVTEPTGKAEPGSGQASLRKPAMMDEYSVIAAPLPRGETPAGIRE